MAHKTQLITYINRFGMSDIPRFHEFMNKHLHHVFGGIHVLPFYYPIDGVDAGYDPVDNAVVDKRLGTWANIKSLSQDYELMADMIVNHISAESPEFQDVLEKGRQSPYFALFLRKDSVFNEDNEADVDKIVRPQPTLPFTPYTLKSGEEVQFWTTFSEKQIDIDVFSKPGREYIENTLRTFANNGIKFIRLDAVGFAVKKAGTNSFLIPETYALMADLKKLANSLGLKVLVEVHAHFNRQIESAKYVDYVYDFALPPLVLYSLEKGQFDKLKTWVNQRPDNCFNVLDTHDGIGVNDVQSDWEYKGLLSDDEADWLIQRIHTNTGDTSRLASGTNAQNLDIYHINSTYYHALGKDDFNYLAARAIQVFLPGIPQIYYAGFLAADNDIELVQKTNVGRDINRPYYDFDTILERMQQPIVVLLQEIITLRNEHPSFQGKFKMQPTSSQCLQLSWQNDHFWSQCTIDLNQHRFLIELSDDNQQTIQKPISYGS